jgi:hypothetical protein
MEAGRKLVPTGFQTGGEVLKHAAATRIRITTGCKDLDAILGGGVETGSVTEVFGEFRCGKTQLAATLAVTAQLDRASGGASGKVIILDTENAFRVERIAEIAEKRFGLDPAAVLDNVTFARCLTHEHQQEMAIAAAALITGSAERYRLLVVDSVIGLYRTEFTGRGELADRQQKLGGHIRALVKLAAEFNLAVCVKQAPARARARASPRLPHAAPPLSSRTPQAAHQPGDRGPGQHVCGGRKEARGREHARPLRSHARAPAQGEEQPAHCKDIRGAAARGGGHVCADGAGRGGRGVKTKRDNWGVGWVQRGGGQLKKKNQYMLLAWVCGCGAAHARGAKGARPRAAHARSPPQGSTAGGAKKRWPRKGRAAQARAVPRDRGAAQVAQARGKHHKDMHARTA